RFVYVILKRHSELFFEPIRINYSQSEQVEQIDEIENNIARECLRFLGVEPPIYISTVGDVPASTGLGGSSAFTVGLLNALHAYKGERVSPGQLAEEASHIEIDVLQEPIGKQDQYAAAFGGLNLFCFNTDGGVTAQQQRLKNGELKELFRHVMMFWTGHRGGAGEVLAEQKENTEHKLDSLRRMRDQAQELHDLLDGGSFDIPRMGAILDEGWQLKSQLASTITNNVIDEWYGAALNAGALGGKLCGAGGGGFLLFIVPLDRQPAVRRAMQDLTEMVVVPEVHGSRVVIPFNG
ncbi:GHMP kinase, partial [Gemmatimonadota bacterium]